MQASSAQADKPQRAYRSGFAGVPGKGGEIAICFGIGSLDKLVMPVTFRAWLVERRTRSAASAGNRSKAFSHNDTRPQRSGGQHSRFPSGPGGRNGVVRGVIWHRYCRLLRTHAESWANRPRRRGTQPDDEVPSIAWRAMVGGETRVKPPSPKGRAPARGPERENGEPLSSLWQVSPCGRLAAFSTRVSSHASRPDPYVRLSRIRVPPRVSDGRGSTAPLPYAVQRL